MYLRARHSKGLDGSVCSHRAFKGWPSAFIFSEASSLSSRRCTRNSYREGANDTVPSPCTVLLRLLLPLGSTVFPYRLTPKGYRPLFSVDVLSPLSFWSGWLSYLLGACVCSIVSHLYCLCPGLLFLFFTVLRVFYKEEELMLKGHPFTVQSARQWIVTVCLWIQEPQRCGTINRSHHPSLKLSQFTGSAMLINGTEWHL